jgi:outer membrane lipoprotein-sorting protein
MLTGNNVLKDHRYPAILRREAHYAASHCRSASKASRVGCGSLLLLHPHGSLPTTHWSRSAATMNDMKIRTLCIALLFLLPAAASAQTADEILAKVITARGGLSKLRALHSQRISGTISFGDVSGPFIVEFQRPLKMHMQFTVQNQTLVRVYDGQSGWANNPFTGKMNPEVMSNDELKNISEESDFDGPLLDYKRKGNQIDLVGKDKFNGKDVWRLKLTTKNGDVRFYLFDATSFLLLKWEGKRKAEGQELPVESYFTDYRDVGGLKFAFAIDSGTSPTDINQKIRIDKIDLNPRFNDAEFAKPTTPAQPGSSPPSPPSQLSAKPPA